MESNGAFFEFAVGMDAGDESAATKLWSVYISEAEKYDKSLMESWKSDMEGMLIFVSHLGGTRVEATFDVQMVRPVSSPRA